MRIRFLVLTYERPNALRKLLTSIRRQHTSQSDIAITVLDNASSQQASLQAQQACQQLDATYVLSPVNTMMRGKRVLEDLAFGEGPAGDVVVHVDDDVVLTDGWLDEAVSPLRRNTFGACGSVEMWQDRLVLSGQQHLHLREVPTGGTTIRVWDWQWQDVDARATDVAVEFAGHRALAVLADLATHTRHDPHYLIGGEDLDYSLKLRHNAHQSIGIATKAIIHHRAEGEQDAAGFRTHSNVVASWSHFYHKWGFLRANACHEAGLTFDEFAKQVICWQDHGRNEP